MEKEVISTFRETIESFTRQLAAFRSEQFNKVPYEESWTAAQVADHILKSQSVLPGLLDGKLEPTIRDPEEKKATVKKIFLDFTTKMKSPEFILPSTSPLDREQMIEKITGKSTEIIDAMQSHDLDKTCLDFMLPNTGTFTGLEWGWFITYHIQRHTYQLQNILKYLSMN